MENKSIADRVWAFFSSVKLAIVVFSLIGLTSIAGTILEQQAAPQKNIMLLSKLVGEGFAPTLYQYLEALGFMNMYRSWWFLALLMLFGLNLLICSIDRFPGIWRLVRTPMKPLKPEGFGSMPIKAELVVKQKPETARANVLKAMQSAGFKPSEADDEGGVQLYAQKTPWSRFGIYLAHLSILIIMAGALVGVFFGFKAFVNIPEGAGYSVVFSSRGLSQAEFAERNRFLELYDATGGSLERIAGAVGTTVPVLKKKMMQLGVVPLDFTVRCDDFEVDFYSNSDMPKAYRSLLTVVEGDTPVLSKWIEVNDPLKYKGVTFYQSSYGLLETMGDGAALLKIKGPGGTKEARLKIGEAVDLPQGGALKVVDFSPALSFDQTGRPFTYSEMMNNPAIRVEITGDGEGLNRWILKRYPETWRMPDGSVIEFSDFWGVSYTGLQARRDPGVWIVYLGCAALSLGLFVAFFLSHRKLWVRLVPEKGGTRVLVAGHASKNRHSFERELEKMTSLLSEGGK